MNIRETVARLNALADRLPSGQHTEIQIWSCDGSSIDTCRVFDVAEATVVDGSGNVDEYFAVIKAHPHDDPQAARLPAATEGADEQLRRWTDEQRGESGPPT